MMVEASGDGVLPPLTEADFDVLIGGQPRVIVELMPPPTPLTVLFLGDVSRSVVDRSRVQSSVWIDPISSAARHFVGALHSGDRARLMTVAGDHFNAGPVWSNDQRVLQEAAEIRVVVLLCGGCQAERMSGVRVRAEERFEQRTQAFIAD